MSSEDSLKKLNRIVAILTSLQAKRIVKAQDLADRFGVSLRTIYRDVKTLESAGVPILSEEEFVSRFGGPESADSAEVQIGIDTLL